MSEPARAEITALPDLLHQWDAKAGVGVQKLDGRYRCVLWGCCARCGQFVTVHVDASPSLVLPQSVQQQVDGLLRQMSERMARLVCPGPPLPLPQRNGGA